MFTNKYQRIPLSQIKVARETRHRSVIDTKGLKESIARMGVMNPIIVDREFNLLAGERRYTASKELGLSDIPVRFVHDLPAIERQIIELEENLKRSDLTWPEQAKAVNNIHQLYKSSHEQWSQADTARALSLTEGMISMLIGVGQEVEKGNPRIASATSARMAHNTLAREKNRRDANLMEELIHSIAPADYIPPPNPESILTVNFHEWATTYSGQPFNFIHCDFPFGVNIHESDQARSDSWSPYDDSPETYWQLLATLADNQDRFISSTAHMVFWFSMQFYCETLAFFNVRMSDWEVNRFPLIWDKTDNKGILPDPKRGPRRTYESAFILTRGDRFIVKAVKNSYGCPSTKDIHQSEKPEPMLRHFFTMFIDEHSRMLDPTCGSGTALRAAESLGAPYVLGLENNEEYAQSARDELRRFRTLRGATK